MNLQKYFIEFYGSFVLLCIHIANVRYTKQQDIYDCVHCGYIENIPDTSDRLSGYAY